MLMLCWQLLYPVVVYNLVTAAVSLVPGLSDRLLGQGIAAAVTVLVLLPFYRGRRRQAPVVRPDRRPGPGPVIRFLLIGASASLFLNNLIAITGLSRLQTGYKEVSEIIFSSPFAVQILASVAAIPVAEEMIFRGLGYATLRTRFSVKVSMLASAFLFGVFHGNLLQFLYAFAIGLILAWCYEAGGGLWASVLPHAAANLVSVVLQNAGAGDFRGGARVFAVTVLAGGCLWTAMRRQDRT